MANDKSKKGKPGNVKLEFPVLQWKTATLENDLISLKDYAILMATACEAYYESNSRWKKGWAKALRLIAIIATALGGLIPVISQMTTKYKFQLDPTWATVSISIAITAIGLDRFFGFSSAWMRFITTEVKINGKIEQFRFNIENERFSWAGGPVDFDKAKNSLVIIGAFVHEISEMVKDETNTWMQEFQNALQKLNEEANVKAESSKPGGMVISIQNGQTFTGGITLTLDGHAPVRMTGSSHVFNNLYPKIYSITAEGTVTGTNQKGSASTLGSVTSGNVTNIMLSLS